LFGGGPVTAVVRQLKPVSFYFRPLERIAMLVKVPAIADVNIELFRGDSQQLMIVAFARVPKYPNVITQLEPHIYVNPPSDGIYDYNLVANLPELVVGNPSADTLISAHAIIRQSSTEPVKGVRVWGEKNSLVMRVPHGTDVASKVSDDFKVMEASTKDDKLIVKVQYSGGSVRHDFNLEWDGAYLLSIPPQARMKVVHNSNNDPSEVLITEELQFDMLDLAPSVIRLSSDFGYASSVPFKLESPNPPSLIPFGPGGIPIIDKNVLRLFVSLLQDNAALKQFTADPLVAMRTAGLTADQISFFRDSANNGGFIFLGNGSTGILADLGVRKEVLDALCR
jgi:hypothetical protein